MIIVYILVLFSTFSLGAGGGGGGGEKKASPLPQIEIKFSPSLSDQKTFASGEILDSDKLVKIPKPLVAKLEEYFVKEMKRLEPQRNANRSEKEILSNLNRRYLRAVVRFDDGGSGGLYRPTEYESGRGGMIIDLKKIVSSKRANFRVEFLLSPTGKRGEWIGTADPNITLKTFFVSNSKKRILAGETYGSGCSKYSDLTSYFFSQMANGGFVVNTTEQRYASVLSGTYVFGSVFKGDLYLASVTLLDSRFPEFDCRET